MYDFILLLFAIFWCIFLLTFCCCRHHHTRLCSPWTFFGDLKEKRYLVAHSSRVWARDGGNCWFIGAKVLLPFDFRSPLPSSSHVSFSFFIEEKNDNIPSLRYQVAKTWWCPTTVGAPPDWCWHAFFFWHSPTRMRRKWKMEKWCSFDQNIKWIHGSLYSRKQLIENAIVVIPYSAKNKWHDTYLTPSSKVSKAK